MRQKYDEGFSKIGAKRFKNNKISFFVTLKR